ncbi:gliding motility-associated C-terminal domain-containing protein [Polluticoccus soli]|uniref:gliding motility-associated C-terminal domain-containing protein n=1 Tax=Polluticoccus soli TaxID=3034150 RepID=UPI0023E23733|nr:gliding motility-associated C-terminal domain-containing protein [Flavipsychrobacter sp. JY13-12]
MQRLHYFVLLLVLAFDAQAQNLIPNPSFEKNKGCPNSNGQVATHCSDWFQYLNNTPDYYHSCGTTGFSVPDAVVGYQQAAHGNAFVGVYVYGTTSNMKEWVAAQIPPLQKGANYELSMSVVLANSSGLGTDNLGAFFYNQLPAFGMDYSLIPQVSFLGQGVITDTLNWTRLVGIFTADSAYTNIVLGGFYDNSVVNKVPAGPSNTIAYYYIDSVVLKQVSKIIVVDPGITSVCAGDTIDVPYTASSNITFNPGNQFSLQLSDASGNFAPAITIGSLVSTTSGIIRAVIPATAAGTGYKVRIVASDPNYTSDDDGSQLTIKPAPIVTASSNSPVCKSDTLKFTLQHAYSTATYSWIGPGFSSTEKDPSVSNVTELHAGVYKVKTTVNGCAAWKELLVKVDDIPSFYLGADTTICNYEELTVGFSQEGHSYLWNTGATSGQIKIPGSGTYSIIATNHCGSASDSIAVEIEQCDNCAFMPNAFTPNNDGLNDGVAPIIHCEISDYKFIIVNRYGEEVFRSSQPGEKWNGLYKGQLAELGTYYYIVNLTGPRNKKFLVKGDITLVR